MEARRPVLTTWLLLVALFVTACSSGDTPPATTAPAPASGAPVANAGPNQGNIALNTLVTLNGSGSTNPTGTPLTYAWAFTSIPAGSTAVLANATTMAPSFTLDRAGNYIVQLIVNNGTVDSAPDSVTISSNNVPPIANAGPDQGGKATGSLITLNGSASSDPNGNLLTYSWTLLTKPAGSTATLTNATSVTPTFVVDREGSYTVQLIVNDGTVNSAPDTVIINSINNNVAPVANAGPDQASVAPNALVTLNGSGSSDANGDPLSYIWTLISKPAGSAAVLANAGSVTPTFTVDRDGDYVAQLIVSDGTVNSAPDTVKITSNNVAPTANAGPDKAAAAGTLVTLNGIGSSDANGDPITYSWTFISKPATSAAVLVNASSVSPSFTADRSGNYVVQLVVNDGTVNSAPDSVLVTTGNVQPVAKAGPDQGGKAPGSLITLNGSASSDANGDLLTYSWSLTKPAGSAAVLANATTVSPTFTVDRSGNYTAQLIVNDGTVSSAPDSVIITTNNVAPVANAGADQLNIEPNTLITLNGNSSSDANGDPLTYSWSLTKPAGSTAVLTNATSVSPTFTVDRAGDYIAQLIVNDGTVSSTTPDSVLVRTKNVAPVANAGANQTVAVCSTVALNGSGSFDPNGVSPLSYNWTLPIKPSSTITTSTTSNTPITSSVTLANPSTGNPSFTTPSITGVPGITPTSGQNVADLAGLYTAQLTVSDGVVTSPSDSVNVTAQETYIGTLTTIQSTYQTKCVGCHFIGALGSPSNRNHSKQGLGVQPRFGNGSVHNGNSLTANQILDMCVFFQTH